MPYPQGDNRTYGKTRQGPPHEIRPKDKYAHSKYPAKQCRTHKGITALTAKHGKDRLTR